MERATKEEVQKGERRCPLAVWGGIVVDVRAKINVATWQTSNVATLGPESVEMQRRHSDAVTLLWLDVVVTCQ